MIWPTIGLALVCTPSPKFPASSGYQIGQGSQMLCPPGGPILEESDVVP